MGLETVELVMEVEDRFDIKVSDADAERVISVGDLHVLVCKLLELDAPRRCLTRPMFYRVRSELIDLSGVKRAAIRPRTRVEDILPRRVRRQVWPALGQRLGIELPALRINAGAHTAVTGLVMLSSLAIFFGWALIFAFPSAAAFSIWLSVALGGALLAFVTYQVARPFSATVPVGCETLAALTRAAVVRDPATPSDAAGDVWSPQAVYEELRSMIVETLGVKPEAVTPNAEFIRDFGAG